MGNPYEQTTMKVYIVKSIQNGIDRYSGARFDKNLAVYDTKEKAELSSKAPT